MMRTTILWLALATLLGSCTQQPTISDPIKYVDPFIGTGGHGHTYPGATSPFGMVQLSPDTRLEGWDGCSGYHYSDSVIYGFSHTHLSGTGVGDYADVLLMPINGPAVYKNTDYASAFSHENEIAEAGFYKVKLDKHNITAQLTTSPRTGMHKYDFSKSTDNKVIIDLNHRDVVLDVNINLVNDSCISGYRISRAWASEQYIYFYIQFSEKIAGLEIASKDSLFTSNSFTGKDLVASIQFDEIVSKTLQAKVGISAVDINGAKQNLFAENPNWDFEAFKKANQDQWRKELNKIQITDENESRKTIFYTSLYHNLIVPNLFSDVDGKYRGTDLKVHESATDQYTIFSLWDTYRATHPLYTIIDTKRTADFLNTFKNQFQDGGQLPVWELAGNYTGCMIGYHSIPVITDAYLKGLTDISGEELLEMMLHSAMQDHLGLEAYKATGYISISDDAESVSKTLEYAYDDWCIAQVAKKVGNDSIYKTFLRRAQSYKNILDPSIGYMRPKLNQIWKAPFDPSEVDFNYTEANSWQYSFYVPQDLYTFAELLGGEEVFEKQLDDLFSAPSETSGRHQSDITGLIGQYAHGNEPSHHMAYLYNYVDKSTKTQNYVQRIVDELYTDQPDGLCGNEDCGQMSAWFVFSSMGFYPVNPANGEYIFGKPFFTETTLNLENGKQFTIKKEGSEKANAVVEEIFLNGKKHTKAYINHKDIMEGGTLTFKMSDDKAISFAKEDRPNSKITEEVIIPVPAIREGTRVFRNTTTVTMECIKGADVFYSINGEAEQRYENSILIDKITEIEMRAVKDGVSSKTVRSNFYKIPEGRNIDLKTKYQDQYSAGGNEALIDGLIGTENFRTGTWQGYRFEDFEAVVDLGTTISVKNISINFIQDARSWIWMPEYVEYWGSKDNKTFIPLGKVSHEVDKQDYDVQIKAYGKQFPMQSFRYIKVFARNHNICPEGHLGEGGEGYVFMDEITIK